MKQFLLIIFALFTFPHLAFSCQNGMKVNKSAFVYFDGEKKRAKVIKGIDIEDPANKIILIFNEGGWGKKKKDSSWLCLDKDSFTGTLGQLSGRLIKGKEIVLWMNKDLWKAGKTPEVGCAKEHKYNGKTLGETPPWWECILGPPTLINKVKGQTHISNFSQFNRLNVMQEIVDTFESKGTPRGQIFLIGQSCGGMEALRMEALYPELFNATIALVPNCWDRSEHSPIRKIQLDEIRNAKKLNTLIFHSEVDGEEDYHSDSRYLKWMADIPGTKWIELPKHNSENRKKFVINGITCKIKQKMRGGWDTKHNIELGHKKKAYTIINPDIKMVLTKKDRGHAIPQSSCFVPYLDDIEKFIESKI